VMITNVPVIASAAPNTPILVVTCHSTPTATRVTRRYRDAAVRGVRLAGERRIHMREC
jgi:hypothetical protein